MPPKRAQKIDLKEFQMRSPVTTAVPARVMSPPKRTVSPIKDKCVRFASQYLELMAEFRAAGGQTYVYDGSAVLVRSYDNLLGRLQDIESLCSEFREEPEKRFELFVSNIELYANIDWDWYRIPDDQIALLVPIRQFLNNIPAWLIDEAERLETARQERRRAEDIKRLEHQQALETLKAFVDTQAAEAESRYESELSELDEISDKTFKLMIARCDALGAFATAGISKAPEVVTALALLNSTVRAAEVRKKALRADIHAKFKPYYDRAIAKMTSLGLSLADADVRVVMLEMKEHIH